VTKKETYIYIQKKKRQKQKKKKSDKNRDIKKRQKKEQNKETKKKEQCQSMPMRERELLENAAVNTLQAAHEKALKSVAIPAISTGIFGFPLNVANRILVLAAVDFFPHKHTESALREIRFVAWSEDDLASTNQPVVHQRNHHHGGGGHNFEGEIRGVDVGGGSSVYSTTFSCNNRNV
jgi:hypothetical protein